MGENTFPNTVWTPSKQLCLKWLNDCLDAFDTVKNLVTSAGQLLVLYEEIVKIWVTSYYVPGMISFSTLSKKKSTLYCPPAVTVRYYIILKSLLWKCCPEVCQRCTEVTLYCPLVVLVHNYTPVSDSDGTTADSSTESSCPLVATASNYNVKLDTTA